MQQPKVFTGLFFWRNTMCLTKEVKITKWEIVDHQMDHAQYFQGCGVSNTPYTHCWTGAGDSSKEAYNDALDQAFADLGEAASVLPTRPRGIAARPTVPKGWEEYYFYVSIRAKVKEI